MSNFIKIKQQTSPHVSSGLVHHDSGFIYTHTYIKPSKTKCSSITDMVKNTGFLQITTFERFSPKCPHEFFFIIFHILHYCFCRPLWRTLEEQEVIFVESKHRRFSSGLWFALFLPLLSCIAVLWLAVAKDQELSISSWLAGSTRGGYQTALFFEIL